jgi:hypothetical protein
MAKIIWENPRRDVRVSAQSDYVGILLCPQCSGDNGRNLHIIQASVHRGADKITVTSSNVSIDGEQNTERGTIITLEYEGECGHHGEIMLHFYKGSTYISYRPLKDIIGADGHTLNYSDKGDIFRD